MVNDYYILFKFQVIINNSENLKRLDSHTLNSQP